MTTISIITPWHGETAHLLPDYAAAVAGADDLILIDNATPPTTAAMLDSFAQDRGATIIRNKHNLGFGAANNQGFAEATGDIVLFLNSDVAAGRAWLDLVRRDVQPGIVCGPSVAQQLVWGMWLPYVEGWCVAARRVTWEAIVSKETEAAWAANLTAPGELWDTAYPIYWEDNDLCLRALQAGVNLARVEWPLTHKGGQSAGALVQYGQQFEVGRARYAERVAAVWRAKTAGARLEGVEW